MYRVENLLMACLHWHFTDVIHDFHLGEDVIVEDATTAGDGLIMTLLMPNGDRKTVVLTAREVSR